MSSIHQNSLNFSTLADAIRQVDTELATYCPTFRKGMILFLFLSFTFIFPPHVLAWSGKVVGVADGDTIKVLKRNQQVRIRLYGIDCPEKRQPFGHQAKRYTNSMVRGKRVKVHPVTKDRYGRTVAMVSVNGQNLNQSLVRAGFAWVYPKYCKMHICTDWYRFEAHARKTKQGLWRDPNPVPPWEWRRQKR